MANWAIVVGINEYWNPGAHLRGAVSDALKMTEWLVSPEGGRVPPRNLFLLTQPALSAAAASAPPPPNIQKKNTATKDALIDTINDCINKSNGQGERFYFYFSGHGIINRQDFTDEQALVMSDFNELRTDRAIKLSSIVEYFGGSEFIEQFFFIDACRNVPGWNREFRLGDFPLVVTPDPARPIASQYVLYATAPRRKAIELNERGAFTEILLAGLRGAGAAKIYDKTMDDYSVRVDRLFEYVEQEVKRKELLVSEPPSPPLYQRAYKEIKGVGAAPVLARFERDAVEAEKLNLMLEPDGLWQRSEVRVRVTSEDAEYDEEITQITGVPLVLPPTVLPMSYTVRATAQGYEPERKRWSFDLYEPQEVKLRFNASVPQPATTPTAGADMTSADMTSPDMISGDPPIIVQGGGDFVFAELEVDAVRVFDSAESGASSHPVKKGLEPPDAPRLATLKARSLDPLAPIEITDNKGRLIAQGQGVVLAEKLEAGFYRARLVTPEGKVKEELVELTAGDEETVDLEPPPLPNYGMFKEIVDRTMFDITRDGTLHVSEIVGSMASPQLSTMLALSGSVIERHYGWGERTQDVGLPAFHEVVPDARSGMRVVCADEAHGGADFDAYLAQVKLRLSPQDDARGTSTTAPAFDMPLRPIERIPGLADFVCGVEPGAYELDITLPERPRVKFAVAALSGRLTLLVLHRRANGSVSIFCYAPSLNPREERPEETAVQMRRLELLQRFYMNDNLEEQFAYSNAVKLLETKWLDPLAGCLGGYTMLKLGKAEELSLAVNNMMGHYPGLSDSYVLAAEHRDAQGEAAAAVVSYKAALDCGLPVFAEGLRRLAGGVERHGISHPRAGMLREAFQNHVRKLLWTGWTERT